MTQHPPRTGPRNLITDVDGVLVGHASDPNICTGVSVITSDRPFVASYHVMGGAPGTRDTDLLAPDKTVSDIDTIVLSGGSAFGLDAASGVSDALRQQGRGFAVGDMTVPIVPAAILFDLANGGTKDWDTSPYPDLGRRAYAARGDQFDLGTIGAGYGALCGTIKGGLGSASLHLSGGGMIGAMIAANPVGNPCDGAGRFWAAPYELNGEYGGMGSPKTDGQIYDLALTKLGALHPNQNTTIGIIATDITLDKAQLARLATAAHDGIARAISPAHLPFDGDLIFAISTAKRPAPATPHAMAELCHFAAACVARSVARGVYHATAHPTDVKPSWAAAYGDPLSWKKS